MRYIKMHTTSSWLLNNISTQKQGILGTTLANPITISEYCTSGWQFQLAVALSLWAIWVITSEYLAIYSDRILILLINETQHKRTVSA